MSTAIDKNKLKELIHKTPTKDLIYLNVNPVEKDSLAKALKEIDKFAINGGGIILCKK
jgi:hypothetical protein